MTANSAVTANTASKRGVGVGEVVGAAGVGVISGVRTNSAGNTPLPSAGTIGGCPISAKIFCLASPMTNCTNSSPSSGFSAFFGMVIP